MPIITVPSNVFVAKSCMSLQAVRNWAHLNLGAAARSRVGDGDALLLAELLLEDERERKRVFGEGVTLAGALAVEGGGMFCASQLSRN